MFFAIDRVTKLTLVAFHETIGKMDGTAFLRDVVEAFPYKIHTVFTDNGKNRNGPTRRFLGPPYL